MPRREVHFILEGPRADGSYSAVIREEDGFQTIYFVDPPGKRRHHHSYGEFLNALCFGPHSGNVCRQRYIAPAWDQVVKTRQGVITFE